MKFYFVLVIFLSSFILIPFTPQEQKKIKKSLPRKQLTRLRQSISLSVNPEELFSSTSTSTLIAGVNSNKKNVKFPSPLSNELLSSFTSTTIRSSLNNAYLLGKKKYYSYFKKRKSGFVSISDATDSVIGAVSITKNAVGIIGVITIGVIAIGPILKAFVFMTFFNLSSAVCDTIADERISKSMSIVAEAIKHVFGIMIMVMFLFIIAVTLMIKMSNFSLMYR